MSTFLIASCVKTAGRRVSEMEGWFLIVILMFLFGNADSQSAKRGRILRADKPNRPAPHSRYRGVLVARGPMPELRSPPGSPHIPRRQTSENGQTEDDNDRA